jgi:hypothetical protein
MANCHKLFQDYHSSISIGSKKKRKNDEFKGRIKKKNKEMV